MANYFFRMAIFYYSFGIVTFLYCFGIAILFMMEIDFRKINMSLFIKVYLIIMIALLL